MKSNLFSSILLIFLMLVSFQACKTQKQNRIADSSYACPMHPEITGKKGGHCSKCHMALTESRAPAVFCCAIHKECTGKMGEKCSKCGTPMDEPVQPYCCPMHPDQKGKKGERCSKCHMDLEPQKPMRGHGRK